MWQRSRLLGLVLTFLACGPARADEPAKPPPAAPAPNPVPPPRPDLAADASLAAVRAKDESALKALAAKDDLDPWLVADELMRRGEFDAAEAFAKAAPRAAVQRLPDYVASRRGKPDDPARRERVAKANAAFAVRMPQEALDANGAAEPLPIEDVVGIRLAMGRGLAFDALNRLEDAHVAFRSAAEASERIGWLARASVANTLAGKAALRGSAFAAARQAFEHALSASEALGDKAGAAGTLFTIGVVHYSLGDYPTALSTFQRALAAAEALGDKILAAHTLDGIGNVHDALGNYAQALSFHERALSAEEALGDEAGAAGTLSNIGGVHALLGNYAKALSFHERALAAQEALGDKVRAASALQNIGVVYQSMGEYAKAFSTYERVLSAKEALGDKEGVAGTLINIGILHSSLGDYPQALRFLERGLSLAEEIGQRRWAANALGGIGLVHLSLGDYAKALSTHERTLAAQEALGDRGGAAGTLVNIGNVYGALGDYAKSLRFLERGQSLAEEIGHRQWAANALNSIGNVHKELGDYATALSTHERALAAQEAMGDKAGAAGTLVNIGNVYDALGESAKALSTFERALAAFEAVGNRAGAATTLGNIGNVHLALGDPAKALSTYERALAAMDALGDKEGAARTLCNVGLAQHRAGDLKAARASLERSVRSARSLRAAPVLVDGLGRLAAVYLDSGASGKALAAAREGLRQLESILGDLGEEQGALARQSRTPLFDLGVLAAAREEDPAEALSFLESGRAGALLDALGKRDALRWRAESLPEDLRAADSKAQAEARGARRAFDGASRGGDRDTIRAASAVLDAATDDVRAVDARIQRENKRAAGLFYPRAKTLEDIRAALDPGDALVLYGLCIDEALALVVRHDDEKIVSLGKRKDLEDVVEALDATDSTVDVGPALSAVRKALVEPLALGPDVKRVLISPEGPLGYVPLGALFAVPVAMTPSGTTHVLLRDEERDPGEGVLALGDPDYAGASEGAQAIYFRGRALTALPATRAEVEAVGTTTLVGAKATVDGLRAALAERKRWRAVHFACHGLVDAERPTISSLALSRGGDDDGFLTAMDVLRMKIPADLVVLSACETGKGKVVNGEGIVGLTRAFMYAGTARVICSLWKVDDEATRALMTEFYRLWSPKDGKPGLATAEALRAAQEFVRAQEKWKHPYYWAAWVLWGLP